jgi:hypothetical protein
LNLVNHWDELWSLDDQLKRPLKVLFAGAAIALVGDLTGLWDVITQALADVLPALLQPIDITAFIYLLVPVFALSILGQEMFMARSRSSKANDALWVYLVRYVLAITFLATTAAIAFVLAKCGGEYLIEHIQSLIAQPQTAHTMLLIAGMSAVSLLLIGVLVFLLRVVLAGMTYTMAFIMQGKPLFESIRKGQKLFSAHAIYTLSLMFLQFGFNSAFSIAGEYAYDRFQYSIINHGIHFATVLVLLLYCTLMFAYHKRISKIPTNR